MRLLPYFDAYAVGCHPRETVFPGRAAERALAGGQAGCFPVLLVDGVVAGVWHQRRSGRRIDITVEPLGADLRADAGAGGSGRADRGDPPGRSPSDDRSRDRRPARLRGAARPPVTTPTVSGRRHPDEGGRAAPWRVLCRGATNPRMVSMIPRPSDTPHRPVQWGDRQPVRGMRAQEVLLPGRVGRPVGLGVPRTGTSVLADGRRPVSPSGPRPPPGAGTGARRGRRPGSGRAGRRAPLAVLAAAGLLRPPADPLRLAPWTAGTRAPVPRPEEGPERPGDLRVCGPGGGSAGEAEAAVAGERRRRAPAGAGGRGRGGQDAGPVLESGDPGRRRRRSVPAGVRGERGGDDGRGGQGRAGGHVGPPVAFPGLSGLIVVRHRLPPFITGSEQCVTFGDGWG
nr:hypothetical protein GCM10020093_016860 [Planobispora longispora]